MKKFLWAVYFLIISYLPVEKIFHLSVSIRTPDLIEFFIYSGFLATGLLCVYQTMSIIKSVVGILTSILFSIQLGILNMIYFFGEQIWFYSISILLSLLLASPLIVKCTFFALKEIKRAKTGGPLAFK